MRIGKLTGVRRKADQAALGAINRPLRGCAAMLSVPDSFVHLHYHVYSYM